MTPEGICVSCCRFCLSLLLTACATNEAPRPTPKPAPAAATATPVATATTASEFSALRQYLGKYPNDDKFLEAAPLAPRLKALLGAKYSSLLTNMQTAGPLREENGAYFVTGNKQHSGGTDAAAVVADPGRDAPYVWLLVKGKAEEFTEKGQEVALPADVRTVIAKRRTRRRPRNREHG